MKKVIDFVWYCIRCMLDIFSAQFGYVNDNYTCKDSIVGFITLIVIMAIVIAIAYSTGAIKFRRKNKKVN